MAESNLYTNDDNLDSANTVKKLYDQDNLLEILIEIDAIFDNFDLYAFENWIDGEIVSGPWLKKYWIELILKYPYKKMPNPDGGMRLLNHGAKIIYEVSEEENPVDVKKQSDIDLSTKKPKMKKEKIWLIHFKLPRRFIEDMDLGVLNIDDEEEEQIDLGDAQEAEESGIEDEATQEDFEDDQDQDKEEDIRNV